MGNLKIYDLRFTIHDIPASAGRKESATCIRKVATS
jgi:hypothetical protein